MSPGYTSLLDGAVKLSEKKPSGCYSFLGWGTRVVYIPGFGLIWWILNLHSNTSLQVVYEEPSGPGPRLPQAEIGTLDFNHGSPAIHLQASLTIVATTNITRRKVKQKLLGRPQLDTSYES